MTQMTEAYWTATAYAAVSDIKITKHNKHNNHNKPKEPVTLYSDDGSMYTGHVNERGEKHGQGTLKTEIYITGVVGDDKSHLMKWTEYSGNWCDGLLHGHGVMRQMCGSGANRVVYEGLWENGVPTPVQ